MTTRPQLVRFVMLGMILLLGRAVPSAAVPVTVTVTKISGTTLEAVGRKDAEWYVGVTLDGVLADTRALRQVDRATVEPFWSFTRDVPAAPGTAAVKIQVWEADGCDAPFCTTCWEGANICGACNLNDCSEDDHADVNPADGPMDVELVVNLVTGTWSGTTSSNCAAGDDSDSRALLCWDIAVGSTTGDDDGDGLLDNWERHGVDLDGDGNVDLDLPKMGANPLHKDLFLEFDWMPNQEPTHDALQAVKDAFAAAPVDAGGIANPDGLPGITLHIDTGDLKDANGLVGDDLGGGNELSGAASDICFLESDFYDAKAKNFDRGVRGQVFRYGISARCTSKPSIGGQGEVAGNDFIEYFHHAGVIMHEFGHTLNLGHGGPGLPDPDANACKPNYLSVMNYNYLAAMNALGGKFGIDLPQSPAFNVDYSPPRFSGGRGRAPLPSLFEEDLLEELILDPTDPLHMIIFMNGKHRMKLSPVNKAVDWSGDLDVSDVHVIAHIDDSPLEVCKHPTDKLVLPANLEGYDDWRHIVLSLHDPLAVRAVQSVDAAIEPSDEPVIDPDDLRRALAQMNTADLQVTDATGAPESVRPGGRIIYRTTVKNLGPNPSLFARVVYTLPAGVRMHHVAENCVEDPPGTITCDPGILRVGESRTLSLATTAAATVPPSVVTRIAVVNRGGPDPDPQNDGATVATRVRP